MSDFTFLTILLCVALAVLIPVLLAVFRKSFLKIAFVAITVLIALTALAGYSVCLYGLKLLWGIFPFFVVLAFSTFFVIMRMVQRPIHGLISGMEKVASTGNLTERAPESFSQRIDEVGQLTRAFESVVLETQKILKESNNVSHTLIEASEQFKAQSGFIATRANDQSSSTEEISSAMEEMSSNINQNLENANHSANLGQQVNAEVG
ncbi:MAG TPA: methyl-accepting chemotaxis protein, partial [Salinivirgaceae bacterium]|nr:methyl-accepting chemotaxis protein [Salinivirgaceae bacterium]